MCVWGGYSGNIRFGLRTKSWNFEFWGGIPGTSDLDLGESWKFECLGGIPVTSDLDLGQKVRSFNFGGVFREPQIWT